jgi:hypothetical protein
MKHFEKFLRYIAKRQCGASALAIIYRMNDVVGVYDSHPKDQFDFDRCQMLLAEFPDYRLILHHMSDVSAEWALLIEHWEELESLYQNWQDANEDEAQGLKLYYRLQELFNSIPCVVCNQPLNGSYTQIEGKRYHFRCEP